MTDLQRFTEMINRLKEITAEASKLVNDIVEVAGGNLERHEEMEIRDAIGSLNSFLSIREVTLEDETEESFENFKHDSYFGHDDEMREYFKLSNVDQILFPITNETLAAKSYMYEQGIENIGNLMDEINDLENHAYKVMKDLKKEMNERDLYYDPDYDEENE